MQSMSVTPEMVNSLSEQIRTDSNNIRQTLDTLEANVKTLKNSWQGEALESYNQAEREWKQLVEQMNATLVRISSATGEMANAYVSKDKANASLFQ
ncbi:WXG100 family type VII secretion target [Lysinibacter cavernae]|uniref:ESAT-6-like protein n=1 Tax=Lysinibacter cavernae TaxID=1640652 RepID=A0A7X5TUU9_9MICO|nr:WXG100 family type VII secretion target [Lysinibacter cavernae]NIH53992.1 WXG100 family type VII secretion target [Lysinibacter cavernae]